jgi:hypothetical protein
MPPQPCEQRLLLLVSLRTPFCLSVKKGNYLSFFFNEYWVRHGWYMLVTPALWKHRQEELEFQASWAT